MLLADYLSHEVAQQMFFDERESGPSNKNVGASDAIKGNIALSALAQQSEYAQRTDRTAAACLPQNASEPAPDRQVVYAADRAVEQQDEPQKQVEQA